MTTCSCWLLQVWFPVSGTVHATAERPQHIFQVSQKHSAGRLTKRRTCFENAKRRTSFFFCVFYDGGVKPTRFMFWGVLSLYAVFTIFQVSGSIKILNSSSSLCVPARQNAVTHKVQAYWLLPVARDSGTAVFYPAGRRFPLSLSLQLSVSAPLRPVNLQSFQQSLY